MGTRNIAIGLILLTLGCAPVEPGTLTKTIERNESRRIYQRCMMQRAANKAYLKRHCGKLYILYHANKAWEACMNELTRECGRRPRYEDIP